MEYSLSKAAEVTGKGKATIHRAIKSGRLSAHRHDDGSYTIDGSELHRVFPLNSGKDAARNDSEHPTERSNVVELEVLRIKVTMLEEQLGRERETVEDLRKRLDRAEERALALSSPTSEQKRGKGFFGWLSRR